VALISNNQMDISEDIEGENVLDSMAKWWDQFWPINSKIANDPMFPQSSNQNGGSSVKLHHDNFICSHYIIVLCNSFILDTPRVPASPILVNDRSKPTVTNSARVSNSEKIEPKNKPSPHKPAQLTGIKYIYCIIMIHNFLIGL
jgi:hypothetical protein